MLHGMLTPYTYSEKLYVYTVELNNAGNILRMQPNTEW